MRVKLTVKETVKTIGILLLTIAISSLFYALEFSDVNIIMLFILGVVVTAIYTRGYVYCISFSVISVFVFNFFFTQPRFHFLAYSNQYPLTFVTMFIIAFLAGTLTARLKKQMELSEKNAMLVEKERIRSNIMRSVSHDLRTPLTSILGCASVMLTNESLGEENKKQMLLYIKNDTEWLISLIENILNISKIEEGELQVDKASEAIEEIITEVIDRTHTRVGNRKIETHIPDDVLFVPMNGSLIIQVFINIIENAIKRSPDDSVITISVCEKDGMAVISISDQGKGIEEKDLPHIFEMFYTTENPVDSRRGAGLGLSICKAIINAHGGWITANNSEGGGAEICFSLPLNKEGNKNE